MSTKAFNAALAFIAGTFILIGGIALAQNLEEGTQPPSDTTGTPADNNPPDFALQSEATGRENTPIPVTLTGITDGDDNNASITVSVSVAGAGAPDTSVLAGVSRTPEEIPARTITGNLNLGPDSDSFTFYVRPAQGSVGGQFVHVSVSDGFVGYTDPELAADTWRVRTISIAVTNVADGPTFTPAPAASLSVSVQEAMGSEPTFAEFPLFTNLNNGQSDPTGPNNSTVQVESLRLINPNNGLTLILPSDVNSPSTIWDRNSPFGEVFGDEDVNGDGQVTLGELFALRILKEGCHWPPPPGDENLDTACYQGQSINHLPALDGFSNGDSARLGVSLAPDAFFERIEIVAYVRDNTNLRSPSITMTLEVTPTNDPPQVSAPSPEDMWSASDLDASNPGGVTIENGVLVFDEDGSVNLTLHHVNAGPRENNQGVTSDVTLVHGQRTQGELIGSLVATVHSETPSPRGRQEDAFVYRIIPVESDYFGRGTVIVTLESLDNAGNPLNDPATFTLPISVRPINDPPTIQDIDGVALAEDAAPGGIYACRPGAHAAADDACPTITLLPGPLNEINTALNVSVISEFPAYITTLRLATPEQPPTQTTPVDTIAFGGGVARPDLILVPVVRPNHSGWGGRISLVLREADGKQATISLAFHILARDDTPTFVGADGVALDPENPPVVVARPFRDSVGETIPSAWVALFPDISVVDVDVDDAIGRIWDLTGITPPPNPDLIGQGASPAKLVVRIMGDDMDVFEHADLDYDESAVTDGLSLSGQSDEPGALTLTLASGAPNTLENLANALRGLRYRDNWLKPSADGRRTIVLSYNDGGDTQHEAAVFSPPGDADFDPQPRTGRATVLVSPGDNTPPGLGGNANSFSASLEDATLVVSWRTASTDALRLNEPGRADWLSYRIYAGKNLDSELSALRASALAPRALNSATRTDLDDLPGYLWARRSWLRPELYAGFNRANFTLPPLPEDAEDAFDGFNEQLNAFTLTQDEFLLPPQSNYTLHLEVCDLANQCAPYNRVALVTPPAVDDNDDGIADNLEAFIRRAYADEGAAVFDRHFAPGSALGARVSSTEREAILFAAAALHCGGAGPYDDSDGDGVPDNVELRIGTDCRRALADDFVGNERPVLTMPQTMTVGAAGVESPVDPQVSCESGPCSGVLTSLVAYYRSVEGAGSVALDGGAISDPHGPRSRMGLRGSSAAGDALCEGAPGVLHGDRGSEPSCEIASANGGATVYLPTGDSEIWWLGFDRYGNQAVVRNEDGSTGFARQAFRVNPLLVIGPDRLLPHTKWVRETVTVASFGEDCAVTGEATVDVVSSMTIQSLPENARTEEVAGDATELRLPRPRDYNYGCNAEDEITVSLFLGGCAGVPSPGGCPSNPSRDRDNSIRLQAAAELFEGDRAYTAPANDERGRAISMHASVDEIPPDREVKLFYDADGGTLSLVAGLFERALGFDSYSILVELNDPDSRDVSLTLANEDGEGVFQARRVGMQEVVVAWTVAMENEADNRAYTATLSYDLDRHQLSVDPEARRTPAGTDAIQLSAEPSQTFVDSQGVVRETLVRECLSACSSNTPTLSTTFLASSPDVVEELREKRSDSGRLLSAAYNRLSLYLRPTVDVPNDAAGVVSVEVNTTVWSRGLVVQGGADQTLVLLERIRTDYPRVRFPVVDVLPLSNDRVLSGPVLVDADNDGVPDAVDAADGPTLLWSGALASTGVNAVSVPGCPAGSRCLQSSPDTSLRLGQFATDALRGAMRTMGLDDIAESFRLVLEGGLLYDYVAKLPGPGAMATVVLPLPEVASGDSVFHYRPLIGGNMRFLMSGDACATATGDRLFWAPVAPPRRNEDASRGVCPAPSPDIGAWRCGLNAQADDACLLLVMKDGGENDLLAERTSPDGESELPAGESSRDFRVSAAGGITRRDRAASSSSGGGGGGGALSASVIPILSALLLLLFARTARAGRRSAKAEAYKRRHIQQ